MLVYNKILKDRKTLTYTYFIKCKKCGYKTTVDYPIRNEISISRLSCDMCEKPIPQVIIQDSMSSAISTNTEPTVELKNVKVTIPTQKRKPTYKKHKKR